MPDYTVEEKEARDFRKAMIEMQRGTYMGKGELIDYTLYDTTELLSTVLDHRMFTIGLGEVDAVTGNRKTQGETNMVGRVGIPSNQKIGIQWLKIFYKFHDKASETVMQSFYDTIDNSWMNVGITGKDTMGNWKLIELFNMPIAGVMLPGNAGDNSQLASTGRCLGIFPFQLPIVLASLTSFNFTITHTVAPAAGLDEDRITVGLCGMLGRLS